MPIGSWKAGDPAVDGVEQRRGATYTDRDYPFVTGWRLSPLFYFQIHRHQSSFKGPGPRGRLLFFASN
jgi:hypothetical protein